MEKLVNPGNCHCGWSSRLWVCWWGGENVGRRFWGCCRDGNEHQCGFLLWIDLPLCARSRGVISGLLRNKQRLENEVGAVKERELKVWAIAVVLWIYLYRFQERVEDLSFICEDLEVRGELLKKRTNALADEVVMRRAREKKIMGCLGVNMAVLVGFAVPCLVNGEN